MTRNRTPGRAGEREPGLGQGDQLQDSAAARVGQFTELGTLPLDPRPDVGDVACVVCGKGPAEFVSYYSSPETPDVTTKYGFCNTCAHTLLTVEEAARINYAIAQDLAASATWFKFWHNALRWAS